MADIIITEDLCLDDNEEASSPEHVPGVNDIVHDEEALLPPFIRVQKYATSDNVYDRQMVSRVLVELFRIGPEEAVAADIPKLMDLISRLAEEDEIMVRTDLLEQIPNIAAVAVECSYRIPELNSLIREYILPLVVRKLGSADNQERKTAQSTLFTLLEQGLVTRQQAEVQVCPTVLAFSRMERLLDYHTSAVALMSKMAPLLGQDITERVFLDRFAELCTNSMFYVRKVCASHFGDFCAIVGPQAYENVLLPRFIELCKDDIWGVRKACAEVVMSVSCACPPSARRSTLAPVFACLLQDDSRWVRMSAFQTLGPFISTFADPTITSLAYNVMGELVLVNTYGTEFRINSPPLHQKLLYQSESEEAAECSNKSNINSIYINYLANRENEENALGLGINSNDDDEDDEKIVILAANENNFDVILRDDNEGDETLNTEENDNATMGDDMWMLDYNCDYDLNYITRLDGGGGGDCKDLNSNVDSTDGTAGDDGLTVINDLSQAVENISFEHCYTVAKGDAVDELLQTVDSPVVNNSSADKENRTSPKGMSKIETDDDLNKYNLYQYWYVSPELPLDPDIIDAGRSPKKQQNSLSAAIRATSSACSATVASAESQSFSRHLDALYATINFDDVSLNSTFTLKQSGDLSPAIESQTITPSTVITTTNSSDSPDQQHLVPQLLIDHFISMTDLTLAQTTDSEMAYHCAYSLPGVALTLGVHNWHLLKRTVERLAYDMQYKVRRTVASSLHELALILGQEIATNCLAPIFEGFLKDLDEVRIGMLKHLAHFLRLINPRKRNAFLPRLSDFLRTDNEGNWRFRVELAEQLLIAVTLFPPNDASKHISLIAQELLYDKVAAVRTAAIKLVTELVRHVISSTEQDLVTRLLIILATNFAHSKRWKRRQAFAILCSDLITTRALPVEQFANEVMPHLLDLSWDPVPNVRLVVAKTIAKDIITSEYYSQKYYDALQSVLRRLQTDKDSDVRQSALVEFYTNPIH